MCSKLRIFSSTKSIMKWCLISLCAWSWTVVLDFLRFQLHSCCHNTPSLSFGWFRSQRAFVSSIVTARNNFPQLYILPQQYTEMLTFVSCCATQSSCCQLIKKRPPRCALSVTNTSCPISIWITNDITVGIPWQPYPKFYNATHIFHYSLHSTNKWFLQFLLIS